MRQAANPSKGRKLTPKLTANVSLAVGAVFSCGMGAYHFFLPSQFHWSAFLPTAPQPIPWALFSINFFFSFLLLAGGILTFIALMEFHRSSHCDRGILTAHGGVLVLPWFGVVTSSRM